MRHIALIAIAALLCSLVIVPIPGAAAADLPAANVALQPVVGSQDQPIAATWRSGDTAMYVAEKSGRVRRIVNGSARVVVRVKVSAGSEQGLLGLAFSLDGQKLYVDYTDRQGNTHVDEFTMHKNKAQHKTRRPILFQAQPFANHNGGQVTVGPDGMLYVGFGDGGSGGDPFGNAQNLGTFLGKILRINPNPSGGFPYSIPLDNPFVGVPGAKPEIWMYGLRNPWRFSLDRATHDVWIGDVGQNLFEEIDFAPAGQTGINWGWNRREGMHPYLGGTSPVDARDPVIETSHADGNCAITGGYVYRGSAIPALSGAYVYGDFCTGEIFAAVQSGGAIVQSRDLGINVGALGELRRRPHRRAVRDRARWHRVPDRPRLIRRMTRATRVSQESPR